ncbi:hypothetical protein Tsubulata_001735, partial [Turnera subulata]
MIHTNLSKWSAQRRPVDVKQVLSINSTKLPISLLHVVVHNDHDQDQAKKLKIFKDTLMERLGNPEKRRGDFLDQIVDDMKTKKFLIAEHEGIRKRRRNPNSLLSWEEYRSMEFTHMVLKETLRIINMAPGLFPKALKDFEVKGYTIPAGWTLMLVPAALQLNPETFKDPVTFNPWRWKELDRVTISKNFVPFGGGTRQCAGAEYT